MTRSDRVRIGWTALAAAMIVSASATAARSAPPPAPPPPAVTRESVDKLVSGLIESLWKAQKKDGHWDALKPPQDLNRGNYGGQSALVLLALRVSGADENDPRFRKALAWLVEQPSTGTYFRGLRATLFKQIKDPAVTKPLYADADLLLHRSFLGGSKMFNYTPFKEGADQAVQMGGDYSNTQYGILGIWSAADRGYEVPQKFWEMIKESYVGSTCDDGGFSYRNGHGAKGYGTMTAAALASMFVVWEKLYVMNDRNCRGTIDPELVKAIEGGLDWMGKNFSAKANPQGSPQWYFYYLYGLERVGVASGLKYFGQHDWYREVVAQLLARKSLGDVKNQAWALLFLSYGRAPVAFNKLKYPGGWNEHPREYAMLCRWLGKTYERHHNWQIMPINPPRQEDFHDAPILAMSGRRGFTLKKDEIEHIRTYLLRGGMLFGEAIDGSAAFRQSFTNLCKAMFPQLELVRLGPDHPIYTAHFQLTGNPPELLGLSDGVRTLVVLSPKDISCDWQRQNAVRGNGQVHHELAANLVQYASDHGQLWSKEESYWPTDAGKKPAETITLGRVVHGGAAAEHVWNPSGGQGWVRLDILSRNGGGPAIATVPVDLAQPVDPAATPILHITGVGALKLTDAQKANLKAYVQAGGAMLADAAGGNQPFANTFSALCRELFGEKSLRPVPPSAIDPIVGPALQEGKVWYRHRDRLPRSLRPLEVLGVNVGGEANAWNVLFLPYDLTYALVGCPASDPAGLDPASAEPLATALLKWRGRPAANAGN